MDLGFTEEQETLESSARAFVESETSPALARSVDPTEIDRLWRRMVALGWPAVAVEEEAGGAGLSLVELAILLEQVGRSIAPGPLFATAGLFVPAVAAAPPSGLRQRLLAGVVEGRTGTLALGETDGVWSYEDTATTARAEGRGWVLHGEKAFVLDGAFADDAVVLARAQEGLGLFVVPGSSLRTTPVDALDPSLRLVHVGLDGITVPAGDVLAPPGTAPALLERCLSEGAVAAAALIVGTCQDILDRTIDYAKTRKQFDQPIGRFQAVKHKLADMYVAVERARSLVYFAALTIAEDDPRRDIATSMAKAAAGDCQRLVTEDGLQLHGGIGYTWEYDLHLYLKRAKSLEVLLGDSRLHRKKIARQLGLA